MRSFIRQGSAKYSSLFVILLAVFALVAIATAVPSVTEFTSPANNSFVRQNVTFNLTANVSSNATFFFVNSSGSFLAGEDTSNATVLTVTYNTTQLEDGTYNVTANVTDDGYQTNTTATNVNIVVDNTNPLVAFTTGTSDNNTFVNRDWIFVNVSLTETNLKNVTYSLHNATSAVNTTSYYTNTSTFINFTGLPKNTLYYYNVTIYDNATNTNQTETRQITLSALELNQSASFNFSADGLLNVTNVSSVTVNITNHDPSVSVNITETPVLQLNKTKTVTFTTNTSDIVYFVVPSNVSSVSLTTNNTNVTASMIGSIPSSGGVLSVNVTPTNIVGSTSVEITLQMTLTASRYITSSYNSSDANISANGSRLMTVNFTVPTNTVSGTFTGNVTYNSSIGRDFFDFTSTVNSPVIYIVSNYSDVPVTTQNGTLYLRANYGRGNISYNVTLENQGSETLNDVSVSYGNAANFSNGTRNISFTNTSIDASVAAGSNTNVTLTFDLSGNHTGDTNYTNTMLFSSSNGQPFGQQNVNVTLQLTNDVVLNGTVSISNATPGQNMTVNVTVKYQDGSPFLGLNQSHFLVDDKRIDSGMLHTLSYSNSSINTTFSSDGNGNYGFVVPAYNSSGTQGYGGLHTLIVRISNDTYEGSTALGYSLYAPNLVVTYTVLDTSVKVDDNESVTVQVHNNGTANFDVVNVYLSSTATSIATISGVTSCTEDVDSGDTETCESKVLAKSNGTAKVRAVTNGTVGGIFYSATTDSSTITVSPESTTTTTTTTSSSSGSGNTTSTTSSDVKITVSDITITKGQSKDHKIKVENNGQTDLEDITLSLSVPSGWSSSWYKVKKQPGDLLKGNSYTATVTLNVPSTAAVGTTKITVTVEANDEDFTKDADFNIKVSPTSEDVIEVNSSLATVEKNIATLLQSVQDILNEDKNNTNALEAQKNLDEIEGLLNDAKNALAAGDTLTAYQLNEQIKQKIASTESLLTTAKATIEEGGSALGWILVILFVVIASISGLVYYMWLPPSTEQHPSLGSYKTTTSTPSYAPKPITADRYSELKKKMKDYLENMKGKKEDENKAPVYDYQKRARWE